MTFPTNSFVRINGRPAQVTGHYTRFRFNPVTRQRDAVKLLGVRWVGANDQHAGYAAEVDPATATAAETLAPGTVYA